MTPEYNKRIRPILAENCFACHGPDAQARKADLRLDKRDVAVTTSAITPADLPASELIERILSDDPTRVMPPPKSGKSLTAEQKALLKKWVVAGAEYLWYGRYRARVTILTLYFQGVLV